MVWLFGLGALHGAILALIVEYEEDEDEYES
jgi:hypothetical protein